MDILYFDLIFMRQQFITCWKKIKQDFVKINFVKLQSKVQTSVFELGVDFVLPLSQEQEEEQAPPKSIRPAGQTSYFYSSLL